MNACVAVATGSWGDAVATTDILRLRACRFQALHDLLTGRARQMDRTVNDRAILTLPRTAGGAGVSRFGHRHTAQPGISAKMPLAAARNAIVANLQLAKLHQITPERTDT